MAFHSLDGFAAELLFLMSFLDPDHTYIPRQLLESYEIRIQEENADTEASRLRGAINALKLRSLIDERNAGLYIDPLVAQFTRDRAAKEDKLNHFAKEALLSVAEAFPQNTCLTDRKTSGDLLPHALSVLNHLPHGTAEIEKSILLRKIARLFLFDGIYKDADTYIGKALETQRNMLGDAHEETLTSSFIMVEVLQASGRLQAAKEAARRVQYTAKKDRKREDKLSIRAGAVLAAVCIDLKDYHTALNILMELIEVLERSLGSTHVDTLAQKRQLVWVFYLQQDHEKAEALVAEVLNAYETSFGKDHSDTLASMRLMASIYHSVGRDEEATELRTQALEVKTRMLGEKHPQTLECMKQLAISLFKSSKKEDTLVKLETYRSYKEVCFGVDYSFV